MEAVWESFSEDEPEPEPQPKAKPKQTTTAKGKKGAAKGQGSINNYFFKK
jgi:DNA polymerase delta subunit 3